MTKAIVASMLTVAAFLAVIVGVAYFGGWAAHFLYHLALSGWHSF